MRSPGLSRQARCCDQLFIAPGNPGTAQCGRTSPSTSPTTRRCRVLPRSRRSISSWSGRRRRSSPASSTILRAAGIKAFGPRQAAAQLEGSKGFTKDLCAEPASRPPPIARFTRAGRGEGLCRASGGAPIVVKADGLAAGKGVVVADERRGGRGGRRRDARRRARRSRRRGRDRGIPRGRGGELLRALRRRDGAPARLGAGPQARLRRRRAPTPAAWAPIRPPRC